MIRVYAKTLSSVLVLLTTFMSVPCFASRPLTAEPMPPALSEKQEEKLRAMREEVYKLGSDDKVEQSLLESEKVVRLFPDDIVIRRYRAEIFLGLEMPHKCIAECNRAFQINFRGGNEKIHIMLLKARALMMQNELDAALKVLQTVDLKKYNELAGYIHDLKSQVLQKQSKVSEARDELEEALYCWTINSGPRVWVGEVALRSKELGVRKEKTDLPRTENSGQIVQEILASAIADNPVPSDVSTLPSELHFQLSRTNREIGVTEFVGAPSKFQKSITYRTYDQPNSRSLLQIAIDEKQVIVTLEQFEKAIAALASVSNFTPQETQSCNQKRYSGNTYTLDLSFDSNGFKALTGVTIQWLRNLEKKI